MKNFSGILSESIIDRDPLGAVKLLRAKPFIISSTSPAIKRVKTKDDRKNLSPLSTSPAGILLAAKVGMRNPELMDHLRSGCKMTGSIWVINRIETGARLVPDHVFDSVKIGGLGGLGLKEEAAGKVRVFALVDPWTQWLMDPLFRAISHLLSQFPQDGTDNQVAPLDRLGERNPNGPFFCYDLSSATDRLPLIFQQALLSVSLTTWFSQLGGWLLIARGYALNSVVYGIKDTFYYQTGQPMGAKSSFHMMALFHHTIVQWAATRVGVARLGEWFQEYCIVGDDVVIAHSAVAEEYLKLMTELGVKVGLHKSLLSRGTKAGRTRLLTTEFIKRTGWSPRKGEVHDVSAMPVSHGYVAKQMTSASTEFARKYSLSPAQYLTLGGFGYRTKARLDAKLQSMGRRARHRLLAYFSPRGVSPTPLMEWVRWRSRGSLYKATDRKIAHFIDHQLKRELREFLQKLDSMGELLGWIKKLTTVNLDRQYYGTAVRKDDRILEFEQLLTYQNNLTPGFRRYASYDEERGLRFRQWWISEEDVRNHAKDVDNIQFVLDQLVQLLYREAYMDVIILVRDIRAKTEELIEGDVSGLDLITEAGSLFKSMEDLKDSLSALPLPKNIYFKTNDAPVSLKESTLVKNGEKYSRSFRSSR